MSVSDFLDREVNSFRSFYWTWYQMKDIDWEQKEFKESPLVLLELWRCVKQFMEEVEESNNKKAVR